MKPIINVHELFRYQRAIRTFTDEEVPDALVEEVLTAVTLNAAASLALADEVGSLEAGKRADVLVLDAPNLLHLAYHYGVNPVRSVVKSGREVFRAGNVLRPD